MLGISNRVITEGIKSFLNDGYIEGLVVKPKKGMAALCWEMLERLQQNDLQYFANLTCIIQEKNLINVIYSLFFYKY